MGCLEARGFQDISLVKFTPMVLEMGHDYLTNRVTTSLTPVGKCADAPEPLLRPSPAAGHAANILNAEDPSMGYDTETVLVTRDL